MFRIGEFSRLAHVSTRLLRHYDEIGLLKPAEVDGETGYRFYRASQLGDLNRVLVLRDLGFALEQIQRMLEPRLGDTQFREMLERRREEVSKDLELQRDRLRRLERELERLGESDAPSDVLLRELPALDIVSVRLKLSGLAEAQGFAAALLADAPKHLGRSMGRLLVIQQAREFEPDALDLEIGVTLEAPAGFGGGVDIAGTRLTRRRVPAIRSAAVCVRVGPPEAVHQQSQALARRIESDGLMISGPNRELFLKPPASNAPPVIEMQFPVERTK